MQGNEQVPTLDQRIGAVLRAWRLGKGWTQDEAADYLHSWGLPWSRAALAGAELGTKTFDVGEFALLCLALRKPPSEWFDDDGLVDLRPGVLPVVTGAVLRSAFGSKRATRSVPQLGAPKTTVVPREAETKAAKVLGVEPSEVASAAMRAWGRSLTEEREARLAPDGHYPAVSPRTLQARRGAITRRLLDELGQQLGKRVVRLGPGQTVRAQRDLIVLNPRHERTLLDGQDAAKKRSLERSKQ